MSPRLPLLLLATLACGSEDRLVRPADQLQRATGPSYTVVKLSATLGGTQSRGMAINGSRWIAGWSNLSDGTRHAALWRNGVITDLSTLGGPSSTVPWQGLNDAGMVVGISQTAETDPLDEDWSCELAGFIPSPNPSTLICRGFVWQNDVMRELSPLGGNHSFATGVNSLGQIVGWAETAVHDGTCVDKQVLGFRAAIWEPKPGRRDDQGARAAALARRQRVGGHRDQRRGAGGRHLRPTATRPWAASAPSARFAGTGTASPTLADAGRPDLAHADGHQRAGRRGGVRQSAGRESRGRLHRARLPLDRRLGDGQGPADAAGQPLQRGVRDQRAGQVVGISFGGTAATHAFLWQNDVLLDLNDLVDIAPDVLVLAQDIDDDGRITGRVLDGTTGQVLVFVATPIGVAP